MCPRSVEGVLQGCCGVRQTLKKDSALTVVAATEKRYWGFLQHVCKARRLGRLFWEQQLPVCDLGSSSSLSGIWGAAVPRQGCWQL